MLALLDGLGPPVHAVHGNVDEPALRMRLPRVTQIDAAGAAIVMLHDGGPADGASPGCGGASRTPTRSSSATRTSRCTRSATASRSSTRARPTERRRSPTHTMGIAHAEGGRLAFELIDLGA